MYHSAEKSECLIMSQSRTMHYFAEERKALIMKEKMKTSENHLIMI